MTTDLQRTNRARQSKKRIDTSTGLAKPNSSKAAFRGPSNESDDNESLERADLNLVSLVKSWALVLVLPPSSY